MKKIILSLGLVGVVGLTSVGVSASESVEGNDVYYYVESGDTLSSIGEKYGVNYHVIQGNNPHVTNPDIIIVGDKLLVSGESFQNENIEYTSSEDVYTVPVDSGYEYVEDYSYEQGVVETYETYTEPVVPVETVTPVQESSGAQPTGGSGVLNPVDGINYHNGVKESYYSQRV